MLETMLEFAAVVGRQTVILGGYIDGQQCIQDLRKQQGPIGGIEALLNSKIVEIERRILLGHPRGLPRDPQ